MATTTRKYARKGFTQRKAVRDILGPFEGRVRGSATDIVGLDIDAAARLLAALPPAQSEDRHNDSAPTMAEMIKLGKRLAGVTLEGYRVHEDQPGERITLRGLRVPQANVDHKSMATLAGRPGATVAWERRGDRVDLVVRW